MWMTTKKSASEVKKAKQMAEEARKAKNRRKPSAAAKKGGKKQTKINVGNKKKRKKYDSSSSEESFNDYSEEEEELDEDQFIVGSDDEEEDNGGIGGDDSDEDLGGWDSDMEEDSDESDFGARKSSKKKKGKQSNNTALSRSARVAKRRTKRPSWNNKAAGEDDEIEETPAKGRVVKKRAKKKKAQSPIDSDEDMSDVNADTSMDDIYADDINNTKKKGANKKEVVDVDSDSSATAIDEEEDMFTKKNKSPYFSAKKKDVIDIDDNDEGGEEKKEDDEDENVLNQAYKKKGSKKQRSILDDSDSDEEFLGSGNNNVNFDDLDDTPGKPRKTSSFSPDDYADEEEAIAIAEAMKASEGDAGQHKRLKKKGKKKSDKGASSLEQIKSASPAKNKVMYKDDIEGELADSDDDHQEDDEIEVYEVDEGEQTATQVLAEANALSAKIIKAVSGWCNSSGNGGENGSGNNVKGLLLGDGTLNLGNGKADGKKVQGEGDEMWISDETMKEILPNVKLAEYQLLGVNWMALLNRTKFGKAKSGKKGNNVNGILADEMGLGKTVQTIAFLAWLNHQRKTSVIDLDKGGTDDTAATRRPHLIAVPASVLSNWMNEFKKFAPDMVVKKYHGSQAEREEIRNDLEMNHFVYSKSEGKAVIGGAPLDVILTTFSYFSSDSNKNDRQFLRKFDFDYLIVDEGHTLKNPKGLRYKNLYKFKTSHRLLLTGTPVQNSPKELMSLLTFLMPLFDRKTKSSKRDRNHDSDDENDGGERMLEYFVHLEGGDGDDAQAYRKLKQLFAPFVLRRKKDDVLGQLLPPKTRNLDLVPMDEKARTAYDSILADHVKARSEIASGAKANATAQQHLFTQLRKAANHPLLLRKRFTSEEERKDLAMRAMNHGYFGSDASLTVGLCLEEMDKYSDYEIHCAAMAMIEENPSGRKQYLEKYTLMEEDLFCSPKFVRLRSLLPELIGNSHRLLVFSQWTKIMDLMEILMNSLNLKFLRLDGSTAVSKRQDLIDTFNNDDSIPVFLLSTRAGGMGLNLTAADVCILHDLDFNPFNDRQAEDRCHRIGQKKPVTVIKLVSEGTVDEDIYRMQERKESMNDAIMEDGGGKKKKKSKDNEEMANMTNAALERFMKKSPLKLSEAATSSSNDASLEAKSSSNDAVVKNTRPELTTAKMDDDSSTEDEQDGQKPSAASALKQNNSTADDVIKLDDDSSPDDEQKIKKPAATTLHAPIFTGANKKIDGSSTDDEQILRPTVAAAPKYASKADEEAASESRKRNVPDNNESDGEATVKQDNKQEKKGPLLARLAAAESSDSDSNDDMLAAFRAKKAKVSAGKSKSLSY